VLEALVEAMEDVEDKDLVIDKGPQISQGIGHVLQYAIVFAHGEVALYKITESSVKVKSMCLMITKELVLETEPQVLCSVATFLKDLLEVRRDCVGEPAEDYSAHPGPAWIIGEDVVRLDMVKANNMLSCNRA
jgi:hypothetical protein